MSLFFEIRSIRRGPLSLALSTAASNIENHWHKDNIQDRLLFNHICGFKTLGT